MGSNTTSRVRLGAYCLQEELGRGAFGVVWRSQDPRTGEPLAIKVPLGEISPELEERIRREARLASGLKNECLVGFRGLIEGDGHPPALIYELIPGITLDRMVPKLGMPLEEALPILSDLASGLDALHQSGLLHRDLKPENVVIQPDGRARLIDLGLLRPDCPGETLTQTGLVIGTPEFMAPECLRGEPLLAASDRYALGCLGFYLLTGGPPFTGSLMEVVEGHLEASPPRLPGFASQLSWVLAKDAEERPSTCEEWIEGFRSGGLSKPPPVTRTRRMHPSPPASSRTDATRSPTESIPPPPGATRTKRPAFLVLAVLALVLVGAWTFSPVSTPPVSLPPPRVPEIELKPAVVSLEEVLEEISRLGEVWVSPKRVIQAPEGDLAEGSMNLLDRDPALVDLRREKTPKLTQLIESLREDEGSRALTRPLMADLDEALLSRGLPRLFGPILDTQPTLGSIALPRRVRLCLRGTALENDSLPRVHGWLATSVSLSEKTLEEVARLRAVHDPNPFNFFGEEHREIQERALSSFRPSLWVVTRNNGGVQEYRLRIRTTLKPAQELLRAAMYTAIRSIQEEPQTAEAASLLIRKVLDQATFLYSAFLLPLPPDLLFLYSTHSPAAAVVLANVLKNVDEIRLHWRMDRIAKEDLLRTLRRALGSGDGSRLARERQGYVWTSMMQQLTMPGDYRLALDLFAQHWPALKDDPFDGVREQTEELMRGICMSQPAPGTTNASRRILREIGQWLRETDLTGTAAQDLRGCIDTD